MVVEVIEVHDCSGYVLDDCHFHCHHNFVVMLVSMKGVVPVIGQCISY